MSSKPTIYDYVIPTDTTLTYRIVRRDIITGSMEAIVFDTNLQRAISGFKNFTRNITLIYVTNNNQSPLEVHASYFKGKSVKFIAHNFHSEYYIVHKNHITKV